MTPLEIVNNAASRELTTEDGESTRLELLPGLSARKKAGTFPHFFGGLDTTPAALDTRSPWATLRSCASG